MGWVGLEEKVSQDLLVTKLYIPPARKNLVPRHHLIQLLNKAWQQERKLILVSAAAGYGKTTLVTEWLHGSGGKNRLAVAGQER